MWHLEERKIRGKVFCFTKCHRSLKHLSIGILEAWKKNNKTEISMRSYLVSMIWSTKNIISNCSMTFGYATQTVMVHGVIKCCFIVARRNHALLKMLSQRCSFGSHENWVEMLLMLLGWRWKKKLFFILKTKSKGILVLFYN